MATLVLTVAGDDRAGLVKALADVVSAHGGNWERSHLAELAGTFAGVVLVTVPDAGATALREALAPLDGLLEVAVRDAAGTRDTVAAQRRRVRVDVLGNDHPGIVQAVSGVLAAHGASVAELETATTDAPMAGGRLFEAHALVELPDGVDTAALQADLERIASEVQVDVTLGGPPEDPAG